jgi:hypothetical protein
MEFKVGLIWKPTENQAEGIITEVGEKSISIKWIKAPNGRPGKDPSRIYSYSIISLRKSIKLGKALLIDSRNIDPNFAFSVARRKT